MTKLPNILILSVALAVAFAPTLGVQRAAQASSPPTPGICLPATFKTVHDGDTATDVVVELHIQVRYLTCWAPELSQPGGPESAASAKQAEGKHGRLFIPLNDPLELWRLFTFGRVLGEFWPDGQAESESERQVRLKMAASKKGNALGQ